MDDIFFRQLEAASHSQVLFLMGDLNHPDICWMENAAEHEKFWKFLESADDNF